MGNRRRLENINECQINGNLVLYEIEMSKVCRKCDDVKILVED